MAGRSRSLLEDDYFPLLVLAGVDAAGFAGVAAGVFGPDVVAVFGVAAAFVFDAVFELPFVGVKFVTLPVVVFAFDCVPTGAGRAPLNSLGLSTTFLARKFSMRA